MNEKMVAINQSNSSRLKTKSEWPIMTEMDIFVHCVKMSMHNLNFVLKTLKPCVMESKVTRCKQAHRLVPVHFFP